MTSTATRMTRVALDSNILIYAELEPDFEKGEARRRTHPTHGAERCHSSAGARRVPPICSAQRAGGTRAGNPPGHDLSGRIPDAAVRRTRSSARPAICARPPHAVLGLHRLRGVRRGGREGPVDRGHAGRPHPRWHAIDQSFCGRQRGRDRHRCGATDGHASPQLHASRTPCARSARRSSGVFDADREPDRRVTDADAARNSAGTPECVVLPGWQASDSVPPRLTASLKICIRLRHANASASPPLISNEKVEPGAGALRLIHPPLRRIRGQERQIVHLCHPGMIAQKLGHDPGIAVAALHPQRERLERPADHPAGMRIELRADGAAQLLDRLHQRLASQRCAGDQVGMPTDVLGQRVHRYIGPKWQRTLEDGPKQRVVADDDGRCCCRGAMSSAMRRTSLMSTMRIEWV